MLSPALFSVYIQDVLDNLKKLGVGCHVGETFLGAWAGDFLLLAPNREAMQIILNCAVTASVWITTKNSPVILIQTELN